jgi:hypothetical protein
VAFIGSLPSQSTEAGEDPHMTAAAKQLLADYPDHARWVPDLDGLDPLVEWMAARIPPAIRWTGPQSVRIMWRQEPQRTILLVANPSNEPAAGSLHLPRSGEVSLWNPETGDVQSAGSPDPNAALPLEIPRESARFVVIGSQGQP